MTSVVSSEKLHVLMSPVIKYKKQNDRHKKINYMAIMFFTINRSPLCNIVKTLIKNRNEIKPSCLFRIQGFSSDSTSSTTAKLQAGDTYTTEEKIAILGKVNTCTIDELKRYSIDANKLEKMTAYREEHGLFRSIEEILQLQDINEGELKKFCKSMVQNKTAQKLKRTAVKDPLTPIIDTDILLASNIYTGIWIGESIISYAQANKDGQLLEWRCESLDEHDATDNIIGLVEAVDKVVSEIPHSDVYVVETTPNQSFSRMNSASYIAQLKRQQILAAIVMNLKHKGTFNDNNDGRGGRTQVGKIYEMRSHLPARIYNLLIGSEVVSGSNVIAGIIDGKQEDDKTDLYVHSCQKDYYTRLDTYKRDQMNWALLLTSAFLDIYVRKTIPIKDNRQKKLQ